MHRSSRFLLMSRERCRRGFNPSLIPKSTTTTTPHTDAPVAAAGSSADVNKSTASNTEYVEEIYRAWQDDPRQVHKSWDAHFRAHHSMPSATTLSHLNHATTASLAELVSLIKALPGVNAGVGSSLEPASSEEKLVEDHLNLHSLIRAYQVIGHKESNLDPLGLKKLAKIYNFLNYEIF